MKRNVLSALLLALALVLVFTSVSFAEAPSTADFFGERFGEDWRTAARSGATDTSRPFRQVGDLIYTMGDVIMTGITGKNENGLILSDDKCAYVLATMSIAPAEGTNIRLVPNAGYAQTDLWSKDDMDSLPFSELPANTTSVQEIAASTDAKVLNVWASINGLLDRSGKTLPGSTGIIHWLQSDGSVLISLEFMLDEPIALQETYDLSIHIANWETTPDGKTLWEGHPKADWVFTIAPSKAE